MSLPKISSPEFDIVLPSSGKKIRCRPFLVGDQKILLIALEGNDPEEIVGAIKTVLKNVIVSPSDLDVDKISLFDLEHIFLKLREKSVGEIVELKYRCLNRNSENKVCGKEHTIYVKISDIQQENLVKGSNSFLIHDDIGITLRYPTFEDVSKMMKLKDDDVDGIFSFVLDCVEHLYDSETIYSNFSREQLVEFMNKLPISTMKTIFDFIANQPKHTYKTNYICPKCGYKEDLVFEGLQDFFV